MIQPQLILTTFPVERDPQNPQPPPVHDVVLITYFTSRYFWKSKPHSKPNGTLALDLWDFLGPSGSKDWG